MSKVIKPIQLIKCPKCCKSGFLKNDNGKCYFCNGNNRVPVTYYKWYTKRQRYEKKVLKEIENELKLEKISCLKDKMDKFDKKNPRPKKF